MKLFDVQKEDQGYIAESGQKKGDFFSKERKQTPMVKDQKKFDSWKI